MRSATTSATSLSRSDRLEAVLVGAIQAAHGLLAMPPASERPRLAQRDLVQPPVRLVALEVDVRAPAQQLPGERARVVDDGVVQAARPSGDVVAQAVGVHTVEARELLVAVERGWPLAAPSVVRTESGCGLVGVLQAPALGR